MAITKNKFIDHQADLHIIGQSIAPFKPLAGKVIPSAIAKARSEFTSELDRLRRNLS
jgi:hypothetical protein